MADNSSKDMAYCFICRISHEPRFRHLYTKRHTMNLKSVREKMKEKVSASLTTVINGV